MHACAAQACCVWSVSPEHGLFKVAGQSKGSGQATLPGRGKQYSTKSAALRSAGSLRSGGGDRHSEGRTRSQILGGSNPWLDGWRLGFACGQRPPRSQILKGINPFLDAPRAAEGRTRSHVLRGSNPVLDGYRLGFEAARDAKSWEAVTWLDGWRLGFACGRRPHAKPNPERY